MEFTIPFIFQRSPKIIFGAGEIKKIGQLAAGFGKKTLIVRGRASLRQSTVWKTITQSLNEYGVTFFEYEIDGEPSPQAIDNAVERYSAEAPDCVIAPGGGSVIDAGKAISAMLQCKKPVTQFLEVVGTQKPDGRKIPLIAIPTTSGTGSEATANAVLSTIGNNGFKRSLRHDNYIPDIALVDPELTLSCPPAVTAACGMDALTQLLEAYVSTKASIMTDALCESALPLVGKHLVSAVKSGATDIAARTAMAYASLCSGIALANAGLGVVHGLASLIGALFEIPHGVVCGTLLAGSVRANVEKLKTLPDGAPALKKYTRASSLVSGKVYRDDTSAVNDLVDFLKNLSEQLEMPRLARYGIRENDIGRFLTENVNKNNPVLLAHGDIRSVLQERI
ncbi:MAG TPA: iron-containing alcohol dehydrogenase [Chitinispirillaceae bacterium]|nr:iron-containing alcohol dehydrogenase [Chitinispirillaceae bacterium]